MDTIDVGLFRDLINHGITVSITSIETDLVDKDKRAIQRGLSEIYDLFLNIYEPAQKIKVVVSQINTIIHASGIIRSLPVILEEGEVVESVSLGSGNTGRGFDLETNRRLAEYKFIQWQGGAETVRQNSLFKDFYDLAESDSDKQKYLYVLNKTIPLKFLKGGRKIDVVLKNDQVRLSMFQDKYKGLETVKEYYDLYSNRIVIDDMNEWII